MGTFANAKEAKKAISELDKSTIDGQTRYLDVQADSFKKNKGNKAKGEEKKEAVCKPDCKWCEKGECWTSGQIERPDKKADSKPKVKAGAAGKVQKGNLKQKSLVQGKGKGGGKMAMMQSMMNMMKFKPNKVASKPKGKDK